MLILDLLNKAKAGYERDGGLGEYFDPATGELDPAGDGDGLARFVVAELIETFDPNLSDQEQIEEARRVMMRANEQLWGVYRALEV